MELKAFKEQLTNMVPYRALTGFFLHADEDVNWGSSIELVASIESVNNVILLPYTLGPSSKLKKEVHFNPQWVAMIQDNLVSILGWIEYEKLK